MKNFFELNKPYHFEIADLTALIYTLCAILGIMGYNVSILFCVGAIISTAFCWQAHRINLVVLNASLLIFNLYGVISNG